MIKFVYRVRINCRDHPIDTLVRNDRIRLFVSRLFVTHSSDDSTPKLSSEWRKHQLDKLSTKLSNSIKSEPYEKDQRDSAPREGIQSINSDEELQQMWKDMESRVVNRKLWTVQQLQTKGRVIGRGDVRKTDEEMWLEAGLYSSNSSDDESKKK